MLDFSARQQRGVTSQGQTTMTWKSLSSLFPLLSLVCTSIAFGLAGAMLVWAVAGDRRRGAVVVAAGDIGTVGDVDREDHVDRAGRLGGGDDAGVGGPGEGRVAGARRVVDHRPEGVRGPFRQRHFTQLVEVDLVAGQRLLLQLAAADRLLLDRVAIDLARRVGGAAERGDEGHQGDDYRRRGAPAPQLMQHRGTPFRGVGSWVCPACPRTCPSKRVTSGSGIPSAEYIRLDADPRLGP